MSCVCMGCVCVGGVCVGGVCVGGVCVLRLYGLCLAGRAWMVSSCAINMINGLCSGCDCARDVTGLLVDPPYLEPVTSRAPCTAH